MTTVPADTHATSRALLAGTGVDHDHVVGVVRAALAEDLAALHPHFSRQSIRLGGRG